MKLRPPPVTGYGWSLCRACAGFGVVARSAAVSSPDLARCLWCNGNGWRLWWRR